MTSRRVAFLFPGQGSQHPGMGRELAEGFPESREIFELADRALGQALSTLCFEGGADELALTENTQPAILTASIAAQRVLASHGIEPVAAAGHSLGEYSAHVAAGTLGFEDAVRVVRERGRFMQEAVPVGVGSMAAILGMDATQVGAVCREAAESEVVSPANLNGPSQVVIAGHAGAVERARKLARERGAKRALPLSVSAPFHCALMKPAADRLAPVLDAIDFNDPTMPVFTNVHASPVGRGVEARDALKRQVVSPVRWQESVEAMLAAGIDTFVEVGPGRVLSGLVRGIRKDVATYPAGDPHAIELLLKELSG